MQARTIILLSLHLLYTRIAYKLQEFGVPINALVF